MPCSSPKAKTSATRHGVSFGVTTFSTATYTIESAIIGSTIRGESETTP